MGEQKADGTLLGTDAEYSHLAIVLSRGSWLLSFDILEYRFHISDSGNSCVGLFVRFEREGGC